MKIGVCVKEVPDTASKIEVTADGASINDQNIKYVMNPYDEFALEEALRIQDKQEGVEVVTLSVGRSRSQETIRKGLAMGADRALFYEDDALPFCESYMVASILQKMVERETVDMVLMGKQAVDDDCSQVGPMLAGLLDWPQAINVIQLDLHTDGVIATREIEGGTREILELHKPCVVAVTKGINEPRYASLKGIMAAKKKSIDRVTAEDLGLDAAQLRGLEIQQYELPAGRGAVKMIEGDTAAQAAELCRLLREEAKVL